MDIPGEITLQTTVKDLLTLYPAASRVFFNHHMACVGCSLAAFDTLADSARNYRLPGEQFLREIVETAKSAAEAV